MAEPARDGADVDAGADELRGVEVAQVVEPAGDADGITEPPERRGDGARPEGPVAGRVGVEEDVTVRAALGVELAGELVGGIAMSGEEPDGRLVERDAPSAWVLVSFSWR